MAGELQYYGDPSSDSGLTIVARVYDSNGAQVGSDVSCTETGSLAIYTGDTPAAGGGEYGVRFFDGTTLKSQGVIYWDGIAAITEVTLNTDVTNAQTAIQTDIGNLNNFDPATDVVARVTLVDTTTANTDMRGTDGANTQAPLTAAQVNAEVDTALADYDAPTKAELDTSQSAIQADIAGLNDLSSADVTAAVPSTSQIEAALLNEGDGQQFIDAIVQAIGNINLDQATVVAAIRADLERAGGLLDNLPTLTEIEGSTVLAKTSDIAGLNDITANDVWAVATKNITGGQIDTIAGTIQTLDALDTSQDTQHTATQNAIASLNNLSAADVNAQVDASLADYDGPTKAELDAAQTVITDAIAGLNDLDVAAVSAAIWDYLQTETTVSNSMKEAVETILTRSGLIPAAL